MAPLDEPSITSPPVPSDSGEPAPGRARPGEPERRLAETLERVRRGGAARYHDKNAERGKLFARVRLARLLDPDSFVEDGMLASAADAALPAEGVVTGLGRIGGRPVAVIANDSTVKAGSWGRRTVEKILRVQERAMRLRVPLVYLVDSAGARITDQAEMFPGRRGAGRIFHNQVALSGLVPQVCLLFGPSAAGGAYVPAFCDVVAMVDGNASMVLGSPRMAEMVIGEKVGLEEMGGARMHCTISGCADVLAGNEDEAIAFARRYLSYLPTSCAEAPPDAPPARARIAGTDLQARIPGDERRPFDMREVIDAVVDEGSFLELKALFAGEILTGLGRIDGRAVGIVASQAKVRGGVLFADSADKAARFVWLCDAFGLPLVFLADVPGFMIGTRVERQGIIRAGAKMIAAVSEATVPKVSVIVRKAYGAGLYAMCGPAFDPDACLALPGARIAVMGPEAAVNAVHANRIVALPEAERPAFVQALRDEYEREIDLARLAADLVVDDVIPAATLRDQLSRRLAVAASRCPRPPGKKHGVHPM